MIIEIDTRIITILDHSKIVIIAEMVFVGSLKPRFCLGVNLLDQLYSF